MGKKDTDNASWLRPLPEDFVNDEVYAKRRIIRVSVIVLVLMSFAFLLWKSYTSDVADSGPIPVIRADNSVVKEKPIEPGGKEILFQDKEVFDRVDNLHKEEENVIAASAEIPLKRPVVEVVIEPETEEEEVEIATKDTSTPALKSAPIAAPKPAQKSIGDFMVQVGAFADKKTAETYWATVKKKNSSALINLTPIYMKVDLGARGVLYRVRGGMVANRSAADSICASLKKNKQGCMVVTK